MSTNYYFKFLKKPEPVISNIPDGNLKDTLQNILKQSIPDEIHIGKRSMGWKPSFEETIYYDSVKGMKKFYEENISILLIEDEYGRTLSWKELEEELINWNKDNKDASSIMSLGSINDYHYIDDEGYEFCRYEFI